MKKITYNGKICYLYTEEEHNKALESIRFADRVENKKELLDSLGAFFIEEVDTYD